jgi:hypothetical protein
MADDDGLDDVAAITPTLAVKVAGGSAILSGALCLVIALQSTVILQVQGVFQAGSALFLAVGVVAIISGYRLTRMRGGAATLTSAVGCAVLVLALGWFVLALTRGVLIVLALPMLPVAAVSAITSFTSRASVALADAARKRLRAQGLDVGS